MDNLSNRSLLGARTGPTSEQLLARKNSSISLQSLFSQNCPEISSTPLENPLYPKKEKDPLEIPYHQQIAFAMTLLSLASSCLGGKNASLVGNVGIAVQMGLSLLHVTQHPNIASAMPISMMGLLL